MDRCSLRRFVTWGPVDGSLHATVNDGMPHPHIQRLIHRRHAMWEASRGAGRCTGGVQEGAFAQNQVLTLAED
jgi:hypothetical protein